MELDKTPKKLPGFSDNVAIDAVESSAWFGVVAAAVTVATVAAVSGGGGGGGGGGDDAETLTATSILGDWNNVTGDSAGSSVQGSFTFFNNGSFTFSLISPGAQNPSTGDGDWTLNGSTLMIYYRVGGGQGYVGPADGDSREFIFRSDDGGSTLNFRR